MIAARQESGSVAIVGGGMMGMTLALRLATAGWRTTLFEAAPTPGGLVESQTIGGYRWDRFYHVTLQSDSHLHALLRELGLDGLVQWRATRTGFLSGGRLWSLSNSFEFLRFPGLTLFDKLRLAGTILYAARLRDWRPLERTPVDQWLRRFSGDRTFERVWLPLLREQAGGELSAYQRGLHLGHHRADVWGSPHRVEARGFRVRGGRILSSASGVRASPPTSRRGASLWHACRLGDRPRPRGAYPPRGWRGMRL